MGTLIIVGVIVIAIVLAVVFAKSSRQKNSNMDRAEFEDFLEAMGMTEDEYIEDEERIKRDNQELDNRLKNVKNSDRNRVISEYYQEKSKLFLESLKQQFGKPYVLNDPFSGTTTTEDDGFYVIDIRESCKIIIREMVKTEYGNTCSSFKFPSFFEYEDILGYEVYEEDVFDPHSTNTVSVTKTNALNMIGRAAVGTILAGGVGALLGGVTATKTTTEKSIPTYGFKFYSLIIRLKGQENVISIDRYKYQEYHSQIMHWDKWNEYVKSVELILSEVIAQNNKNLNKL